MPETPLGGSDEAARWLGQARHDLADARFVAEGNRHALACFLAHQCAEKAVTSFLLARGAEFVWGHSLADLCQDAVALAPVFEAVSPLAVLLDKHFFGARYPSALPGGVPADAYDFIEAERAVAIASELLAFVEEQDES